MCEFNKCNKQNLSFALSKRQMVNLQLLEMMTLTMELGQNIYVVLPHDLVLNGARRLLAFKNHRSRTTVESYFYVKYGLTLEHPHMPCVVEKVGTNHENYFPIEALKCYISSNARSYLNYCSKP